MGKKRRKNRITFLDVVRAARIVVNDPDFDPKDREDIAFAVAGQLISERDVKFDFDWDKLLELIEKWLPIILAFFV